MEVAVVWLAAVVEVGPYAVRGGPLLRLPFLVFGVERRTQFAQYRTQLAKTQLRVYLLPLVGRDQLGGVFPSAIQAHAHLEGEENKAMLNSSSYSQPRTFASLGGMVASFQLSSDPKMASASAKGLLAPS